MDLVKRFAPIALMLLILAANAASWTNAASDRSNVAEIELAETDSINIFGNDEFTAENGVVSGSGSSGDPYIIEGWEMDFNSTGTGITVVMTDRYFVIRDVHITGAKIGMRFEGVYHAKVTSSSIENCSTGISATYSEVSRVEDNLISNCSVGVSLRYCDAFKVVDNTFVDNDEDMRVVALPWIETRQADLVFAAIAISLFAFVATLIYIRYKSSRPPEERP
ncbi:MAG: NosD domain-containing protein [Thermoplasmata archaeon]